MNQPSGSTLPVGPVSISLLGGFSIEMNGTTLTDDMNRSLKLWSVLAYLVLHRDRPIPQGEFIERFWPEDNSTNPVNALKTLLYRIRVMLEPLFPPNVQPILGRRGSYSWNPEVRCELDVDLFERLCRRAGDLSLSATERRDLYGRAIGLYRGDLLPKLGQQMWLIPIFTHYHALYLKAVKTFAELLEEAGLFEKMYDVALRASQIDDLDEGMHILVVHSLLCQGKDAAALKHYEKAIDLLYRKLGVQPSEELQSLYQKIMSTEKAMETDLSVIMGHLRETARRPGAFFCEYGFFREVYRLEARRALRNGTCVHLCLITISLPDGSVPSLKILTHSMDQLKEILIRNLRRGDVVSRFSSAQYVVMLPSANFEDSGMVMDRSVKYFQHQHRHNALRLTVRIREIEPEGL